MLCIAKYKYSEKQAVSSFKKICDNAQIFK